MTTPRLAADLVESPWFQTIRERHAKINLDSGNINFNVAQAESPPNSWVFGTQDGVVTIQGTQGNLKRRVSATASDDGSKANIGVDFKVEGNIITVSGIDKEKVGLVAASIKRKRKPDAYKGKGVRYKGEVIKLKEGKKS